MRLTRAASRLDAISASLCAAKLFQTRSAFVLFLTNVSVLAITGGPSFCDPEASGSSFPPFSSIVFCATSSCKRKRSTMAWTGAMSSGMLSSASSSAKESRAPPLAAFFLVAFFLPLFAPR